MKNAAWILQLAFMALGLNSGLGKKCDVNLVEPCFSSLVQYEGIGFPLYGVNETYLDETCKRISHSFECVENFKDICYQQEECDEECQLMIDQLSSYSAKSRFGEFQKAICQPKGALHSGYLESSGCMTSNGDKYAACHNASKMSQVYMSSIDGLEEMRDSKCCFFSWYHDCFLNITRDNCGVNATMFISSSLDMLIMHLTEDLSCERRSTCNKPPLGPKEEKNDTTMNSEGKENPPRVQCQPNENYSECKGAKKCQRNCENLNDEVIPCSRICESGCVCQKGLVRGPEWNCILPEQCPQLHRPQIQCKSNENYSECKGAKRCQRNCENLSEEVIPCPRICESGCVCQNGLVRGPEWNCILPEQCPPLHRPQNLCPSKEYYSPCNAGCERTCTNVEGAMWCSYVCREGCVCEEGLVRGPNGNCISPQECPAPPQLYPVQNSCPSSEYYSECQGNCQRTCNTMKTGIMCASVCIGGCVCRGQLVRGPEGNCIFPQQCPAFNRRVSPKGSCNPREYYSECEGNCQRTCETINSDIMCSTVCIGGCVCRGQFIRGPEGNCIFPQQCTAFNRWRSPQDSCQPNEYYSECGGNCERNCRTLNADIRCVAVCIGGCVCKVGLVRGPEGNCIFPQECPALTRRGSLRVACPRNQHFSNCRTNSFCQRTCNNYRTEIPCLRICVPGCVCNEGFVIGPAGKCIRVYKCRSMNPWYRRRRFQEEINFRPQLRFVMF